MEEIIKDFSPNITRNPPFWIGGLLKRTRSRLQFELCSLAFSKFKMADGEAESATVKPTGTKQSKKKRKTSKKKPNKPVTYTRPSIRKDKNLINKYHALKKMHEAVKKDARLSKEEKSIKLNDLDSKMEKLGGLDAYQKASKLGERRNGGFNSAKWVLKQLKANNKQGTHTPFRKLNFLI
jgi:hypothetical protein